MLKGFNYPLTPKGKSTLNPPPPWYYSADFLNIEFWSEPAAVAAVLPPGLDPDPAAEGHGNALFYDWQFSGANEEYLDPARYQYREFFLLVDALFEGKPVAYCPYIFVDNDAAIGRGWTQGYPKRIGQVFQTRYYAATGKAGPALAPGSKFAGSLTSSGRRLAQALVTLKEPVTDPAVLKQRPIVNLLHTPRLAAGKQDKPAVHELVENIPRDVKIEQAWVGEGLLTLPIADGEEVSDLAPIRCGKGIYTQTNFDEEVIRHTDGRRVDVVYDGVGRSTFEQSLRSLKPLGLLALYGSACGPVPPFDLGRLGQMGPCTLHGQ